MIIVEGPDGAGKTTLAKRLCEDLGLRYMRPPESLLSSTKGPSEGLVEWWQAEVRSNQPRLLYDRCFWVSEPVYTTVQRRQPLVSGPDMSRGLHDLWVANPRFIFCMTDEAAMMENIYSSGRPRLDDLEGPEMLRACVFQYWTMHGLWQNLVNCVFHWDYYNHDYDLLRDQVKEAI